MKKTSSSWLRHLNPFHFESKYLVYSALGNLVIFFTLIFIFALMLFYLPKIRHSIDVIETKSEQVSDTTFLHQTIHGEATMMNMEINSLYSIMVAFAALSLIAVVNSFYLYKAYRLISASSGKTST